MAGQSVDTSALMQKAGAFVIGDLRKKAPPPAEGDPKAPPVAAGTATPAEGAAALAAKLQALKDRAKAPPVAAGAPTQPPAPPKDKEPPPGEGKDPPPKDKEPPKDDKGKGKKKDCGCDDNGKPCEHEGKEKKALLLPEMPPEIEASISKLAMSIGACSSADKEPQPTEQELTDLMDIRLKRRAKDYLEARSSSPSGDCGCLPYPSRWKDKTPEEFADSEADSEAQRCEYDRAVLKVVRHKGGIPKFRDWIRGQLLAHVNRFDEEKKGRAVHATTTVKDLRKSAGLVIGEQIIEDNPFWTFVEKEAFIQELERLFQAQS